uniref:ORFL6R n=1 Tax=Tanapox virus TaxID=99000 RepID=Q9QQS9_9POXV|nr:ORFL6R [Tanapox virus]
MIKIHLFMCICMNIQTNFAKACLFFCSKRELTYI